MQHANARPSDTASKPHAVRTDIFADPRDVTDLESARRHIAHLTTALDHARIIGMAMGILMERERLAPDDAFVRLQRISQNTHRKLWMVAESLLLTGSLNPADDPSN